mmetsp:Transcript_48225/g.151545  ORF Transcript_48225/g.151545 Transcript_48225/m.151545 type:complete len:94 (+) Transcript_48225:43-324(+)
MSLAVAALCVCVVNYDLLSLRDTYDSALGLDKWLQTVPQKQQMGLYAACTAVWFGMMGAGIFVHGRRSESGTVAAAAASAARGAKQRRTRKAD